jgi:hypothetical protein
MNKYLTYEQFGAKGDGVTDDFDAIIACHDEANKTGASVKAKDGAKYYIGGRGLTATVKTSVDFGTAEIIIDDRNVALDQRSADIFYIATDYEDFAPTLPPISRGQKKIDFPYEGKYYLQIFNENKPVFIRKGLNKNSGKPLMECILVENGNILTDVNWDYEEITKVYARRIDDTPITVSGGIFTTIANQAESFYNYHRRGFNIRRANVTVENLTHNVTGELDHGAPYAGFLTVLNTANLLVKNCVLTPHLIYWTPSKEPGKLVPMGSYDINIGSCINCSIEGLTQTVDITDGRYWGIIHTNFSKNLRLERCAMSRYDAHEGVNNIVLKDCSFGRQCVNLIGFGEALIENCHIYGPRVSDLRADYGSFWHGNITVRNVTWHPIGNLTSMFMLQGRNLEDHDFGYPCASPTTLTVDGLTILDGERTDVEFYILPDYTDPTGFVFANEDRVEGKPFRYVPTQKLIIKNVVLESGRPYHLYKNPECYKDLIVEEG